MKLLLYCTKQPHKLYATDKGYVITDFELGDYYKTKEKLNGKIVAECDFEVEEIKYDWYPYNILPVGEHYYTYYRTNKIEPKEFYEKSCLNWEQLNGYLNDYDSQVFKGGYAIHIKNLHIFDEPRDLRDYYTENPYKDINNIFTDELMIDGKWHRPVNHAPQNMMRVKRVLQEDAILISIKPEWLCKILNGEKTIEVRKKILKEMLNNE